MNTKAYIDRRLEEIQEELDGLKALSKEANQALPDGFIAFEPTDDCKCPCHPQDIVSIIRRDSVCVPNRAANSFRWGVTTKPYEIVAYKIVEKHTGPRPMKLAEVPVGVPFARNAEKPSSIWIKTNQGICILVSSEFKNPYTGYPYSLVDGVDYYEVKIKVGG